MKENKYNDLVFFEQYAKMERSQKGLKGAGEWHVLKDMLPDLEGKFVLDLGCGFGWHCRYAIEQGAHAVTGVDISSKMLAKAREINNLHEITYMESALEDLSFPGATFDVILSSLTFHYIQSFETLVHHMYNWLRPQGELIFSVEHPIFTAEGKQDWVYDDFNKRMHWPVDRYFFEGERNITFLGENVLKYHRTITTYLQVILKQGFKIIDIQEPQPAASMIKESIEMQDELRRPMMLLISAKKE